MSKKNELQIEAESLLHVVKTMRAYVTMLGEDDYPETTDKRTAGKTMTGDVPVVDVETKEVDA